MDEEKRSMGKPQIYTGEVRQVRRTAPENGMRRQDAAAPQKCQIHQMPQGMQQAQERRAQKETHQQTQERRTQKETLRQTQERSVQKEIHQQTQERKAQKETLRQTQQHTVQRDVPKKRYTHVLRESKPDYDNEKKVRFLSGVLLVLSVILIAAIIYEVVLGNGTKKTGRERMAENGQIEIIGGNISEEEGKEDSDSKKGDKQSADDGEKSDKAKGTENEDAAAQAVAAPSDLKAQAELKALQYDYDGAIELLKGAEGYEENAEYQAAVAKLLEQKAACVVYPASEVTHIFFHTLIHDAAKAFDGDEYEAGYNQFMVTEYEFRSIIQQMYDRGYVMVFLDEIAPGTEDANGNKTFAKRDIMLPAGKIPFVLSQDDVSYYHYMDGDGYASRLIVDENGDVKNEYIEDDGTVSVGDYDMVPIIDSFVKEHPDFSYHGEKGYIALTGYEGILGYRTDEVYKTKQADRVTVQQQMFFDSYPGGFDEAAFEKECEGAKKVAEAMKANGWRFASHTWGHQNMSETNGISFDSFVRDTDRWETWVEPLIGETDTLIYAFGGDIRGMEKYSGERFEYFKKCGFDYFCGVDSAKYWLQVEPDYVRQSRRNVDGYRMYYNPEMLEDLFDVQKAWDPLRPSTVPPI